MEYFWFIFDSQSTFANMCNYWCCSWQSLWWSSLGMAPQSIFWTQLNLGPIYGSSPDSRCPSLIHWLHVVETWLVWLWLMKIPTQYQVMEAIDRVILGNVAMSVMPSGGQIWNQCKWHHQVAKLETDGDQICNQCKWHHSNGQVCNEITPGLDSILWVCCASGNVFSNEGLLMWKVSKLSTEWYLASLVHVRPE